MAKRNAPTVAINKKPCPKCGIVVNRKSDVYRHNLMHDDDAKYFNCTFGDCTFRSLQKSNCITHMFIHTGEKPNRCPDCEFRTADPGSLTRHRKSFHNYVPKARKPRSMKAPSETRNNTRKSPYERSESKISDSDTSSESSSSLLFGSFLSDSSSNESSASLSPRLEDIFINQATEFLPSIYDASWNTDFNTEFQFDNLFTPDLVKPSPNTVPLSNVFPSVLFPANDSVSLLEGMWDCEFMDQSTSELPASSSFPESIDFSCSWDYILPESPLPQINYYDGLGDYLDPPVPSTQTGSCDGSDLFTLPNPQNQLFNFSELFDELNYQDMVGFHPMISLASPAVSPPSSDPYLFPWVIPPVC